jgi:hypothetical protein
MIYRTSIRPQVSESCLVTTSLPAGFARLRRVEGRPWGDAPGLHTAGLISDVCRVMRPSADASADLLRADVYSRRQTLQEQYEGPA